LWWDAGHAFNFNPLNTFPVQALATITNATAHIFNLLPASHEEVIAVNIVNAQQQAEIEMLRAQVAQYSPVSFTANACLSVATPIH
jgi:hypothetical protein